MKRRSTRLALAVLLTASVTFVNDVHAQPPANPLTTRCPEGQFLDIERSTCRPLMTQYGFQGFPEPGSPQTIACSKSALLDAVALGGWIRIPAGCTIDLGTDFALLASNTILEGAGATSSVITCTGTQGLKLWTENIIVRDLMIDGLSHTCKSPLSVNDQANNVLVEGVHSRGAIAKAVGGDNGAFFTVRYSWLENTRDYHGIGVDDGFLNVAFYSNYITNTGEYGIDSHASQGEIAGNYIENPTHGIKVPDANDIVVHHNYLKGAEQYRGMRTYRDRHQDPRREVFYDNFIDTGSTDGSDFHARAFNFRDSDEIYLAGNRYGTVPDKVGLSDASTVYACAGTDDAQLGNTVITSGVSLQFQGTGAPAPFDPCRMAEIFEGGGTVGPPTGWPEVTASSHQAPNIPQHTLDSDLGTHWSAEGIGQWVQYDFGEELVMDAVSIAWLEGDLRTASFEISLSSDEQDWTTSFSGDASGLTTELERYDLAEPQGRYLRIVGLGNNENLWNSISEVAFVPGRGQLSVNFGSHGLWQLDDDVWIRATPEPPEASVGWLDKVVVDLGAGRGIWVNDASGWQRLTNWDPYQITAWRDRLLASFDNGRGLWEYSHAKGWIQLTNWEPEQTVPMGDELAVGFGASRGLWLYDGAQWTTIAGWSPYLMISSEARLAAAFDAGRGLWSYENGTWTQLAGWEPTSLAAWQGGWVASFRNGPGLWVYDGQWSQLAGWTATLLLPWNNSLTVGFGGGRGLWSYQGQWSELTRWDPTVMTQVGEQLVVGFGSHRGLWRVEQGAWEQLASWDPDELVSEVTIP